MTIIVVKHGISCLELGPTELEVRCSRGIMKLKLEPVLHRIELLLHRFPDILKSRGAE